MRLVGVELQEPDTVGNFVTAVQDDNILRESNIEKLNNVYGSDFDITELHNRLGSQVASDSKGQKPMFHAHINSLEDFIVNL